VTRLLHVLTDQCGMIDHAMYKPFPQGQETNRKTVRD